MSQSIYVVSHCDFPECKDEWINQNGEGVPQEVQTVSYWVYVHGRGRKTNPVVVDLCEEHIAELRGHFVYMQKFSQKDVAE